MSVANLWSAYHYFRAARTLREDIAHGYGKVAENE
jgi:hypothetical protein